MCFDKPHCTCPLPRTQLDLFDAGIYTVWEPLPFVEEQPPTETSLCGREGFWYRRATPIFLGRSGVGPLIIAPDTNVLIDLLDNLTEVEPFAGMAEGFLPSESWDTPLDAINDLLQLWYWRDVRFYIDALFFTDSRKALVETRRLSRVSAWTEFSRDMWDRGGFDSYPEEPVSPPVRGCPLHPESEAPWRPPRTAPTRWPTGKFDRGLVEAALKYTCHVFLTSDAGILCCADELRACGLAVMTPQQLLVILDRAGELKQPTANNFIPDLSALSRFYGLIDSGGKPIDEAEAA